MDYEGILEGIKTDLMLSIDELIHHIKSLRKDLEELKTQQSKESD